MKKAYTDEMLQMGLIFSIPIYDNMRDEASPKPTSTGNNNNWLDSIAVDNYNITPDFDMYTFNYDIVEAATSNNKVHQGK